VFKAQR
jgi:hypothetical protein